jgi:hypothetical protein
MMFYAVANKTWPLAIEESILLAGIFPAKQTQQKVMVCSKMK